MLESKLINVSKTGPWSQGKLSSVIEGRLSLIPFWQAPIQKTLNDADLEDKHKWHFQKPRSMKKTDAVNFIADAKPQCPFLDGICTNFVICASH